MLYVVMIYHPPIALLSIIVEIVLCCSSLEFEHDGIVVPIREWNCLHAAGMQPASRGRAVNAFPEKRFDRVVRMENQTVEGINRNDWGRVWVLGCGLAHEYLRNPRA